MAWITSRAGTHQRAESPEEAVKAMGDMIEHRQPNATLFLVVDEVSQYVLNNRDRTDRLRAFASALGASLRGKVSRVNPLGRLASIKLAGEVPQVVVGDNLGAATRKVSHPAGRSMISTGFS
jgi:hypothetical protein